MALRNYPGFLSDLVADMVHSFPKPSTGEYRVFWKDNNRFDEPKTYYTDDLEDAVNTLITIYEEGKSQGLDIVISDARSTVDLISRGRPGFLIGETRRVLEEKGIIPGTRHVGLTEDQLMGRDIARQLGIRYDGIQEGLGMQFTDAQVTGSTFYGNSLSEVKSNLGKVRKRFGE